MNLECGLVDSVACKAKYKFAVRVDPALTLTLFKCAGTTG